MGLAWWVFMVVGLSLLVGELLAGTFVLIWFGVGAISLGVIALLIDMPLSLQIFIWTVLSCVMTWLWFAWFRHRLSASKSSLGQSDAGIVGEIGLAVSAIEPFGRGKVRFQRPILGSDTWDCLTEVRIEAGARVRVVAIEGNLFKVEAVN